ncbi:ArsR family transcriptional regulator [Bacillus sp. HMF5848]|uniref:ArsR/SmtB family transcription factor n=1 Tax=Bacillus sp. HMF5848 TaxID=2495421 RepID=UPI000F769B3C|nr:metalloregulator ArsR/SmtB family transcription factor [Bacillus sp. HMF5848]RSK28490.1 ArsR family transcriptional regulator [Bacillus sp. HMF5848]
MNSTIVSIDEAASILKILGDKTRLTMLSILQKQDCCVCEFVEIFQMSQPAISQHLRKLRDNGLVKEKRKSQWIIYSLNTESEYANLVLDLLAHIPDQGFKLQELEAKGLRISCE